MRTLSVIFLRGVGSAWLILQGAAMLAAEPPPLSGSHACTIAEVRQPEAAMPRSQTIVVRGRVTWAAHDPVMDGYAVIQDETAGIWVNFRLARRRGVWNPANDTCCEDAWAALSPGLDVIVEGQRDAEGFAPMLLPHRAWIVTPSTASLPPAPLASPGELFTGSDDSQRVSVEGILQSYSDDGHRWILVLETDRQRCLVSVLHEWMTPDPSHLVDGVIRVAGVAASRFTTRGEFVSPSLHVCRSEDISIIAPPAHSPFDAPLVPLARLGRFQTVPLSRHRVRCVGVLTHYRRDEYLYIQEGAVGLRVEVVDGADFLPGDVVEVSGFVDTAQVTAGVSEAAVMVGATARRKSIGKPPAPVEITPQQVIRINADAQRSGLIAQPGDYDGVLVTFPARLVEAQRTDEGGILLLASDDLTLHASASPADFPALREIEVGSRLQVSGVLQIDLRAPRTRRPDWRMPLVQRLGVLLRSTRDVTVIERPAWWNRRRLATALLLAAVGLGGAMGWVWSLRREVAAQALRIREEMRGRREAAVEYQATLRERNRLAANLHDTLLQTLSAIGMQLQSCALSTRASGDLLGEHLDLTRAMVDKAVSDLRGSVWSLRSIPLQGRSFADAVESLGRQLAISTGIQVTTHMDSATPAIPDFVAGNLLLVVQEAMHNAVRHASPRNIRVRVAPCDTANSLSLSIEDDGSGFTPGRHAGPEDGHFGLTVMRERVERLGGSLTVSSRPATGTAVNMTIRLNPHDAEIDAA